MNAGASYFVAVNQPDFLVFGLSVEFLSPQHKVSTSASDVPVNSGGAGNYSANNEPKGPYLAESIDSVSPIDFVNSKKLNSTEPVNPAFILQQVQGSTGQEIAVVRWR